MAVNAISVRCAGNVVGGDSYKPSIKKVNTEPGPCRRQAGVRADGRIVPVM